MRIADVLSNKGAAVATIAPETTVSQLLASLAALNIGAMVVVGPDGLAGIVSERDVVRELHKRGGGLLGQPVSEIMTTVPGQEAVLAVTTCGTAAFPPIQLVIVTAPAEPVAPQTAARGCQHRRLPDGRHDGFHRALRAS